MILDLQWILILVPKNKSGKFVIMWSINNENENFELTYLRCKSFSATKGSL